MNPLCPQCENELDEDFGIVNCKSCGTVCFVDLDGEVQVQGDEPEDTGEELQTSEEESDADLAYEPEEEFAQEQEEDLTEDFGEEADTQESFYEEESPGEDSFEEEVVDETDEDAETFYSDEPVEDLEEDLSLEGVEDLPMEEVPDQSSLEAEDVDSELDPEPEPPLDGQDFLKGLEIFSQDLSQTEDFDHVFYDLVVSDLDDEESWAEVIESLSDERLRIYEQDLLDQKELGGDQLTVRSVPFVRLVVLYKRMAPLRYSLSWMVSENQEEAPAPFEEETEEISYDEEIYDDTYSE